MTRRPPPRCRRAPRIVLAFGLVAALALPATAQEETFDTGSPPEAPGLADPAGNLGVRSIAPPGVDPAFPAPADGLPALAAPYAAPETGATIAEIPRSALTSAWEEAQGGDETTEPGQPDLWLLATTDGDTWLVEDLDEGQPDEANQPQLVAVNGTTVLLGTFAWEPNTNEVWQRLTITE